MIGADIIDQIRRAHASARPKAENPAWMNCHHDCGVLLAEVERLTASIKQCAEDTQASDRKFKAMQTDYDVIKADLAALRIGDRKVIAKYTVVDAQAYAGIVGENERLRAALERIAKPYDCGCRPCHCLDSAETMRLDAQGLRDIAEQALAPPGELK